MYQLSRVTKTFMVLSSYDRSFNLHIFLDKQSLSSRIFTNTITRLMKVLSEKSLLFKILSFLVKF